MTWYSVVPFVKSSDTDALEPTNVPCATARTMNCPVGLVVPCPDIIAPVRSIWADPDDIVYVVPAMVRLPLVSDRVYPCESFPVTVKVRVPEAVPLVLELLMVLYSPDVLVTVMVCPTVRLTWICCWLNQPPCCIGSPAGAPPHRNGSPLSGRWPAHQIDWLLELPVFVVVWDVVVDVEEDVAVCAEVGDATAE
jgi:hypothetical protein